MTLSLETAADRLSLSGRPILIDEIINQKDEVAAGLAMIQRGGDFADGVIAYTGSQTVRGDAVFVSFDKKAARLLANQGVASIIL